jgi:hypothetical protein
MVLTAIPGGNPCRVPPLENHRIDRKSYLETPKSGKSPRILRKFQINHTCIATCVEKDDIGVEFVKIKPAKPAVELE